MDGRQTASGCLFGLAIGDALAAPTEFLSVPAIVKHYGEAGPAEPCPYVTDDTQMALAVGEALMAAGRPLIVKTFEPALRKAFVDWSRSADDFRSPGITCMRACSSLAEGKPWHTCTVARSKGCGANMRVAAVGVMKLDGKPLDPVTRSAVAQFQAALTHGHPTALAASDLTAAAIADQAAGGDPAGLPVRLREYAHSQRLVYHEQWLGALWQQTKSQSQLTFIAQGWDECMVVLDRLEKALARPDRSSDPCDATGEGWVAEEAFGTGLLCFLLFPNDPVAAVRRAAVTRGDSDSIACLTGAFVGASRGLGAWPEKWVRRIEYHDRLKRLGDAWD